MAVNASWLQAPNMQSCDWACVQPMKLQNFKNGPGQRTTTMSLLLGLYGALDYISKVLQSM